MSRRIREHVRSHVVGYIALFVALGGTAWAANTVGSSDVIDNSLQSVDLKDNGAVKSGDVVNDSVAGGGLTKPDLAPNSVAGSEVQDNSLTAADIAGISTFKNSGRVAVNDDPDGVPTTKRLLAAGPFTVDGECTDSGSQREARIVASSTAGPWTTPLGFNSAAGGTAQIITTGSVNFGINVSGSGEFTAPGTAFAGTYGANANISPGEDCSFGIQLMG